MREKLKSIAPYGILLFLLYLAIKYVDVLMKFVGGAIKIASPLIIGIAMAYVFNILMSFYEGKLLKRIKKGKRVMAIILTLVTLLLIIALLLGMILPQVQQAITRLVVQIPDLYDGLLTWAQKYQDTEIYRYVMQELIKEPVNENQLSQMLMQGLEWLKGGAASNAMSAIGVVGYTLGKTISIFMALIFALYILSSKEKIFQNIELLASRLIRPRVKSNLEHVIKVVDTSFHSFIVGQCTEAVILGVLCTLGMLIFRFPYAVMIGVVVGVTAIIPVFGAYIGMIFGFLMIFTESPLRAIGFFIYLQILQQIENQFIYPRVVGKSIGLPGIWVFASVILGSGLFGVSGILYFIPLTAAAYQLVREWIARTPKRKDE